jgi:hypothetical protein
VSKQVAYAKTSDRCEDHGESLHHMAVLGITRAVQRIARSAADDSKLIMGYPPGGRLVSTADRLRYRFGRSASAAPLVSASIA